MAFVPAFLDVSAPGAAPTRLGFVLHGILGSGRNWRSFARRLAAEWPAWRLALVDLRHHGDSLGAPPPDTLRACADDLARLADRLGQAPELVVGHSFGGKVALTYARDHGEALAAAWVLDARLGPGPEPGDARGSDVWRVLEAVREIPQPLAAREDVVAAMTSRGLSPAIAQWMTTLLGRSTRPGEDGLRWRFDLDGVRALLADYEATDLWPVVEAPPPGVRVTVVRAGQNAAWTPADLARLEAAAGPRTDVLELPDAGHWVHADDPDGLARLLARALA